MAEKQTLLFEDDRDLERTARFLRDKGYRVVRLKPVENTGIRSASDLVNLFYNKLYKVMSDSQYLPPPNRKRDLGFAKRLIDSREAAGLSRERALEESALIIEALFNNLDLFNMAPSLSMLGQGDMGWVTDKLLTILNGSRAVEDEARINALMESLHPTVDESVRIAKEFLDQISEDTNGKEKEGR